MAIAHIQVFAMLAGKAEALEGTDLVLSIGTGVCLTTNTGRPHATVMMENAKIAFRTIRKLGDMAIYSMVKNNTFNGMPLPEIILMKKDGSFETLRSFGYDDFMERL